MGTPTVMLAMEGMRTTTKCTPFLDSLLSLQTQTTSLDWLQSVKLRRRRGTLPRRAVIGSRQRRLWQENPDAHRLRAIRATTPSGSRSENPSTSTSTALLLVTWMAPLLALRPPKLLLVKRSTLRSMTSTGPSLLSTWMAIALLDWKGEGPARSHSE